MFTIVKRWPGDSRREKAVGVEHYEVSGWEDFLQIRRLTEERKQALTGHLVVEILDPQLHGWFADIERIGSPIVTVISDSPSEELKSIMKTFGYNGSLDAALSDQVLLELGLLTDPLRLQNLARLYWSRLRENDNGAIPDMLLAASSGLRAFDEPNLRTSGALVEKLLTELFQLRADNNLNLDDRITRGYLGTILRAKIALALRTSSRSEELVISSFQTHLERGDLASWVDSLIATGVLRANPLVPRLMVQVISAEMGIEYLDNAEMVARIAGLLARDNPGRRSLVTAVLRWDRIAEMNTCLKSHLEDLPGLDMVHPDSLALGKILSSSAGILVAELEYTLEKTVDLWKTDPEHPAVGEWMARIRERFSELLEADREQRGITEIVGTFGHLAAAERRVNGARPNDLQGWSDWYKDLLLLEDGLAREAQGIEDLQSAPEFLGCISWLGLKVREVVHSRSDDYVRWLVRTYPAALNSPSSPLLCNCMARVREQMDLGNRIILLMIDSLRMDFWYLIQDLFSESGVEVESYEPVLSMLPSYTTVSRRSFFGGMSYLAMTEVCTNHQPKIDPQDEPSVLAMQLGVDPTKVKSAEAAGKTGWAVPGSFVYVSDPMAFEWAVRAGYPLTVLVYVMLDMFTHPQQHGVHVHKDMMRAAFADISRRLARHLAGDPSMRLIIATDHGFTGTGMGARIPVPPEIQAGSGVVDLHTRFVTVGRLPGNSPAKLADSSLYVFGSDTPVRSTALGLPETWRFQDSGRELPVDYWVFPRGADYFWSKGEFAHGGLSFYETLIPFAILKGRDVKPIPGLRVSVEKRVLETKKEDLVTLVVTNTGNVRLRGLHLQIHFDGDRIREVASGANVEPGGQVRYTVLYTPNREGRITATVRYSADAMGQVFGAEAPLEFSVVPSPEEERRRKLSPQRPANDLLR